MTGSTVHTIQIIKEKVSKKNYAKNTVKITTQTLIPTNYTTKSLYKKRNFFKVHICLIRYIYGTYPI